MYLNTHAVAITECKRPTIFLLFHKITKFTEQKGTTLSPKLFKHLDQWKKLGLSSLNEQSMSTKLTKYIQ